MSAPLLLHQDVTHGLGVSFSIVRIGSGNVSTSARVIRSPSSTKPDSWVTRTAVILLVISNADSYFRMCSTSTHSIGPFPVTVVLQRGLRTNDRLPRVTARWGVAVLPVSDQWVQRVGLPVVDSEVDLLTDLHNKTDLGEGCVPVGRQLSLLCFKPSLPSRKIVFILIAPVTRAVVKSVLKKELCMYIKIVRFEGFSNITQKEINVHVLSVLSFHFA